MTRFGYTLMTEQSGPKELVRYAVSAEDVGFDFEVCSDHYFPWLSSQGHAPYAWTVLGAVAQATERIELATYVTCPTMRYHPAVVAQKAATLQILADGRFTLGLGTGENLNEHVVGRGWPSVDRRHEMLKEAVEIIRELFGGELVSWKGRVLRGRLRAPVGLAGKTGADRDRGVRREARCDAFAPLGDHLIAVEPDKSLVDSWHVARRATGLPGHGRVIGQIPVSWDPDRDAAVKRAHDQFRLVRRRLARQRRPADHGGLRGGHAVRADRRMWPTTLHAARSRRDHGGCARVLGGRLHRHCAGADRRRGARALLAEAAKPLLVALRDAAPK